MDWDFIIHCILAVGLSAALIALLDSRIKLRKERRKTSMFYGISRDLEGDTWKQKDVIEEQNGTIMEQDSTIQEQNSTIQEQSSTIREQMHEIESLGVELKESRAMARMLLERAQDGQGRLTAFTERLLMLIDETANVHYESASSPATLSRRLKETLQTGLTGREALEQIGGLIETSWPGFLSGLFDDFPWLTDDDRLLICLMCCGLSPNAASVPPQQMEDIPRQADGPLHPPLQIPQGPAGLLPLRITSQEGLYTTSCLACHLFNSTPSN